MKHEYVEFLSKVIRGELPPVDLPQGAEQFVDPDAKIKRFLIGKNPQSEFLRRRLPIDGLIDDRAAPNSFWAGIPVVRMSDVDQDAWIANTSSSIAPVSVQSALRGAQLKNALTIPQLLLLLDVHPEFQPEFVSSMRREFATNLDSWVDLFDRLDDDASRKVLFDVSRFRATADPSFMDGYSVRFKEQYLESFLNMHHEVFVDAGGFDGDTTEAFCRFAPDYERVHLFEPSAINMARAKARLEGFPRIVFHDFGLSDKREELFFNATAGSASAVSVSGDLAIQVVPLDGFLEDSVSFIKMDLEGWEMHALKGAANTIRSGQPKLAISVYHHSKDFTEVPRFILQCYPGYKIRLRHYSEGWSETVMFFY